MGTEEGLARVPTQTPTEGRIIEGRNTISMRVCSNGTSMYFLRPGKDMRSINMS
jgi:hypothetical protein